MDAQFGEKRKKVIGSELGHLQSASLSAHSTEEVEQGVVPP